MRESRRKTLHEVMELAAKYFEATLQGRAGAKGRGYLADRGLGPATQGRFRIGYSIPERFALKEALGARGVPVEDMVEAGLLIAADDIPVPYDRFRDRVMFPITDLRGRVVAFGGRALEKDVSYMGERQAFGTELAGFQALRFEVAQMQADLEGARSLLWRAANAYDSGDPNTSLLSAMAKLKATDTGFDVANRALQLHGGYGYLTEYGIEKLVRDLRVHQILEDTIEIMRVIISRDMLRQ